MKTVLHKIRHAKKAILAVSVVALTSAETKAQVASSSGLNFQDPVLVSGTPALQVGGKYRFTAVRPNVDAIVSIDSLINGAEVNKIDDNSNGTGYKEAFQPAVQNGGITGTSYAVFTIKFYAEGTDNPVSVPVVNATALDLDGNNNLKEFARINIGAGGSMSYLAASPDIAVTPVASGDFIAQNILGIERSGIDTSALTNMFTASNTSVSSFTVKYGAITSNPNSAVRQYSLYLKGFNYPSPVLPVKLASFTATLKNTTTADLKWSTASEINTSHFVIERSFDGNIFSEAGLVFAGGNSSDRLNYSFSDNLSAVTSSVVWYRLRSVDMDGKAELSETRIIWLSKQKTTEISITAFPNPATKEIRVAIPANWQNKPVVFEMFAMGGQLVKRMQNASSNQTEIISLSDVTPGIYIVRVNCEGRSAQQRIVKQ